jgi:hypothetical protein
MSVSGFDKSGTLGIGDETGINYDWSLLRRGAIA